MPRDRPPDRSGRADPSPRRGVHRRAARHQGAGTAATKFRNPRAWFRWLADEGEIGASPMAALRQPKVTQKVVAVLRPRHPSHPHGHTVRRESDVRRVALAWRSASRIVPLVTRWRRESRAATGSTLGHHLYIPGTALRFLRPWKALGCGRFACVESREGLADTQARSSPSSGSNQPAVVDAAEEGLLAGYWTTWGSQYEVNDLDGRFLESVRRGASLQTIQDRAGQIRAQYDHGHDPAVGSKPLGTFKELREDRWAASTPSPRSTGRPTWPTWWPQPGPVSSVPVFRFQAVHDEWFKPAKASTANPESFPSARSPRSRCTRSARSSTARTPRRRPASAPKPPGARAALLQGRAGTPRRHDPVGGRRPRARPAPDGREASLPATAPAGRTSARRRRRNPRRAESLMAQDATTLRYWGRPNS